MAAQDRTTLKGYFNTGDVPTEAEFADLIDSFPLVGNTGGAAALDVGTTAGTVAAGDRGIPAGGATSDVLVKTSSTDYAVTWSGSGSTAAATAAQIRQATSGLLIVTPQELTAAEAPVALTVTSNVVAIDGSLFLNGTATAAAATEIGAATNLTNLIRRVRITASAGDWAITANAAYRTINFGDGVTVPSGKVGLFLIETDGTDDWCTFAGLED